MDDDARSHFQDDVIDRLKILLPEMGQYEKLIALYEAVDSLIPQEVYDMTEITEFSEVWEELRYPKSSYTAIKLIAESLNS